MADIVLTDGFSLTRGWPYGSHGWKPGMDTNLLKMSVLLHPAVTSRTETIPASAPQNTCYLVPAAASQYPNHIVVYDQGDRKFITPRRGALVTVLDTNDIVMWDGYAWVQVYDLDFIPEPVEETISTYMPSALEPEATVFSHVPTVKTLIPANLAGSIFHVEKPPSQSVTLTIAPGGSVTFGPGSNFGTPTWPSSVTIFPTLAGNPNFSDNILRISTPEALHGMRGVSLSISAFLVE